MNPTKLGRLIFELAKNARITTKELSRSLSISQQAVSYTIQNLLKDKIIQEFQTIIDPAKFGLINIIVFFNYRTFDHAKVQAIKKSLKSNPWAVRIEDVSQGADLFVEYCVPNLSFFNKQNKSFLYEFKNEVKMTDVYVVIVKHHYTKNYLHKWAPEVNEEILSGDRETIPLGEHQLAVIKALAQDARAPIITIAKDTGLDPKTITRIKKQLEKQKIIRRYSIIFDHQLLDITREHIFINLDYIDEKEEQRLLEWCKQHKNAISLTKLIGPYEILITTERAEKEKPVITDLRKAFTITDYRLMTAEKIVKYRFIPEDEQAKS